MIALKSRPFASPVYFSHFSLPVTVTPFYLAGTRTLFWLLVQRPFRVENRPVNSCKKSTSGSWTSRKFSSGRNRTFLFECMRPLVWNVVFRTIPTSIARMSQMASDARASIVLVCACTGVASGAGPTCDGAVVQGLWRAFARLEVVALVRRDVRLGSRPPFRYDRL
jgi:hypothetical protein